MRAERALTQPWVELRDVPNWSGTVTPSLTGYTFTPVSRDYANVTTDQVNQNYTAVLNTTASCKTLNARDFQGLVVTGVPGDNHQGLHLDGVDGGGGDVW